MIVGDGYMRVPLQFLVKQLRLRRNVSFLGCISEDMLVEKYRSSNLVVVPSISSESIGIVVLEAMASGKPVIASSVGGLKEIVSDGSTGLLVEPSDPIDLADKIILLLSDRSLREQLSRNARKLVVDNYSCNVICDRILDVYNTAIRERRLTSYNEGILEVH